MLRQAYPNKFGLGGQHTTRPARPNEEDGVTYNFVTRDIFQQMIEDKQFLEYTDVQGNLYGTTYGAVQSIRENEAICVLVLDAKAVQGIKEGSDSSSFKARYMFVKPPDMEALEDRLVERGTEDELEIERRLEAAEAEIEFGTSSGYYEEIVTNEVLENCFADVVKICEEKWYGDHLRAGSGEDEEEEKSRDESKE